MQDITKASVIGITINNIDTTATTIKADKTISNIKECKARGADITFIVSEELDVKDDFYNQKIVIPTNHKTIQSVLTVIPLQLIAYEIAKLRKCDIDKPKNLAKSVTVE